MATANGIQEQAMAVVDYGDNHEDVIHWWFFKRAREWNQIE